MTDYLSASILNTLEELQSFPVNQSIFLQFSQDVEDTQIKNYISIFRMIDESGLFNFGDKYNQSIGYVREKFDLVDYTFTKSIQTDGTCNVELKPQVPLHPNSGYGILIDKGISKDYLTITKTVSKSKSNITIELDTVTSIVDPFTITINSTPYVTPTDNLISISIKNNTTTTVTSYNLNLKSSKDYVLYQGIKIQFQDTIYVEGEVFDVLLAGQLNLEESLYSLIKTSITTEISKIDYADNSNRLNYNDVLAYVQSQTVVPPTVIPENTYIQNDVLFKYISSNKILVTLPTGILCADLDMANITHSVEEAYENYTMDLYGYYDPTLTYTITTTIKTPNVFVITVVQDEVV